MGKESGETAHMERWYPPEKRRGWYQERYGKGSASLRKIGIVALARKMLVDLWRYMETGLIPEGAELKPRLL